MLREAVPSCQCDQLGFDSQRQLAHAYQVLRDLGQPLLVLVYQKLWPEFQMLIKLFEGGCVLPFEPDFLPHVTGSVRPLNRLHIQVDPAILFPYCGISAVCEGTAAAVAETCDVVLISAEIECFGLGLEAAVVMIDDLHKGISLNVLAGDGVSCDTSLWQRNSVPAILLHHAACSDWRQIGALSRSRSDNQVGAEVFNRVSVRKCRT